MHGNHDVYVSNEDGYRINPATEEKQTEIAAHLQESVASNSLNWGTQRITIQGDGVAVGEDRPCRTCVISHSNTTVYVGSTDEGTPDAGSFLVPKDTYLEIPVRNTNKLSFFGTAGEYVYVLWRD